MNCVTGKRSYASKALAEEALLDVHSRFQYRPGSGPRSVYECDDCGNWHFTSRGPDSPVLSDLQNQQQIQRNREANDWERKLR